MGSTLFDNNEEIRAMLNGLNLNLSIAANDAIMDNFVDEADAYITSGWGPHPTDAADADYKARRAALVLLVGNRMRGITDLDARIEATAFIGYQGASG